MITACQRDATLQRAETTVLRVNRTESGWSALVSDSVLYPEGGGQPSDTGTLRRGAEEVRVTAVSYAPDGVLLALTGEISPGEVTLTVDWARRFDHMQQHTAQHLLTAVASDRYGLATTSFHLHPGEDKLCDIELDGELSPAVLKRLSDDVNAEIRAARPVTVRETTAEALPANLRSRGLPEGHTGSVRLVEIEGVDINTCGGTHVRNTCELQALVLLGTEHLRGGTRLSFVAGGRVLHRLAEAEQQRGALSSLLSRRSEEAIIGVRALLEEAKGARKQLQAAHNELADALGAALAASTAPVLALHRDQGDVALLNRIASVALRKRPGATLCLTAGSGEDGAFLVATDPSRMAELKPQVLALFETTGGGPLGRLQGKTTRIERRGELLALIGC